MCEVANPTIRKVVFKCVSRTLFLNGTSCPNSTTNLFIFSGGEIELTRPQADSSEVLSLSLCVRAWVCVGLDCMHVWSLFNQTKFKWFHCLCQVFLRCTRPQLFHLFPQHARKVISYYVELITQLDTTALYWMSSFAFAFVPESAV